MIMKECPKCGSNYCVKAGFNHGRQRYKCKGCGRQFTQVEDKNATKRAFALYGATAQRQSDRNMVE